MEPLRVRMGEGSSDGQVVIHLAGELDLASEPLFDDTFMSALAQDGKKDLVVDLTELTFIDWIGLHSLLRLRDAAHKSGSRLRIASPKPLVTALLSVTGMADTFGFVARPAR